VSEEKKNARFVRWVEWEGTDIRASSSQGWALFGFMVRDMKGVVGAKKLRVVIIIVCSSSYFAYATHRIS